MEDIIRLDPEKILTTIEKLNLRIEDRFPDSNLLKVCRQFLVVAKKTKSNIDWISNPNVMLRVSSYLIILIGLAALVYSVTFVDWELENTTIVNLVSLSEAIFNDILLLGAAVFFMMSLESRIKRKRASKALNDLRVLVHVLDMHQLTKDPTIDVKSKNDTEHSPRRTFTKLELIRYLDYCSETTALVSKVSALYSQSLPDAVVVSAVNEIEVLCTGLNQKIWQKVMILENRSRD
ncbi:MAG: hypothetical protein COA58_14730 [Bacteroidetes bacterium]|nr:MAG: hypothetical protein COA58_14730 [Bacteroidota bacterium]